MSTTVCFLYFLSKLIDLFLDNFLLELKINNSLVSCKVMMLAGVHRHLKQMDTP